MKANAIARIIIWSLVLILCLGALLTLLGRERGEPSAETMEAVTEPLLDNAELGYVEKLSIAWTSGSITLEPGDVHAVLVRESPVTDPKYAMVCTQDGDTLTIRYQNSGVPLSIGGSLKKDLTITVPRDWTANRLKVDMSSADLTLRDVSIDRVEVKSASGTTTAENCTVEELELDTSSGGLQYTGRLGKLDVDGASANVTARLLNVPESVELEAASGGMELYLPGDAGFTARLDTMSGKFLSDFETTQEGKRYTCGDGSCKIDAETMSGDLKIRKNEA